MNLSRLSMLFATLFAAVTAGLLPSAAHAANESIEFKTTVKALDGPLFKEKKVPAQSSIEATVSVPPGQPGILPLKQARIDFDTDMTFNPHNDVTPVCPESKVGPQANLSSGVLYMVDQCPESVIGTGFATIYLFKQTSAPLSDPQMVIFNNGTSSKGEAKIKIYAYSKGTGVGILMYGTLARTGEMTVDIPVLAYDSAVGYFKLEIPGPGLPVEDSTSPNGVRTVQGLDRNYVEVKCTSGTWTSNASFSLGERDAATGVETGPTSDVTAPPYSESCEGLSGRARLTGIRKSFPRASVRGKRPVFKVAVRNRGTATARHVQLIGGGGIRGRRKVGNIPPGVTRMLVIRPRVTGRKGGRVKAVVTVRARGSAVRFTSRIRIR